MYEHHFGLDELPFRNTPDEDFFFGAGERQDILIALEYSIIRGDAIVKVVGEVGSGKTTLLRALSSRLQKKGFHIVFVPNPRFTKDEILFYIAADLGLEVGPDESKLSLYHRLSEYLVELFSRGERVVILIDEAHQIPLETLEEIRLLTNIETDKHKLIHIVLFGQPELDDLLERPEARQLRSRIAHAFSVKPLTPQQVHEYLNFRMRKAGSSRHDFFGRSISKQVYRLSKGLPRQINVLADKLLLSAFSRGAREVSRVDMRNVARDALEGESSGVLAPVLLTVVLLVGVMAAAYYWLNGREVMVRLFHTGVVKEEQKARQVTAEHLSEWPEEKGSATVAVGSTHAVLPSAEKNEVSLLHGSKYLIGVVTTYCDNVHLFDQVITMIKAMSKQPLMLRYIGEEGVWCKLYAGHYDTFTAAREAIGALPDHLKVNMPYAIEGYKIRQLIKERRAEVFYGLE